MAHQESGQTLEVVALRKSYGNATVLHDVHLTVEAGEFVSLLGPSGCGKTTLLNVIAGFFPPDGGDVRVGGSSLIGLPPHRRSLAMVFQNYSLFPHMTVAENVAFGLRMRRVPRVEMEQRVREALTLVHLDGMEDRFPRSLSGGQQQRVGLARALVVRPRVLLLDEPLSNLDAKLRKAMQIELRRIQQLIKTTTIYVTHDQEEALTLSDRIALMNGGVIEQVGTPEEVYLRPTTVFAAGFVGEANFLDGTVRERVGDAWRVDLRVGGSVLVAPERGLRGGDGVRLALRPDKVVLGPPVSDETSLVGTVVSRAFLGVSYRYVMDVGDGQTLLADVPLPAIGAPGDGERVRIDARPGDWLVLPSTPAGAPVGASNARSGNR